MALVGLVFARPIIAWFGGEPDVIEQGTRYLRTIAPSFVFISVLLIGNAVLRGAGDTRTPLLVMMVVNVINIGVAWSLTQGVAGSAQARRGRLRAGRSLGQTIGGIDRPGAARARARRNSTRPATCRVWIWRASGASSTSDCRRARSRFFSNWR